MRKNSTTSSVIIHCIGALVIACTVDRVSSLAALSSFVSGVQVYQVPLLRQCGDSPWCYAVSRANELSPNINFLATQVWPSARVAALALQTYVEKKSQWTVCELGCGPGLPSIVAAASGVAKHVIATDVDSFALQLVHAAAKRQELLDLLSIQIFDLVARDDDTNILPKADLYVMSDVFESSHVARGAAKVTQRALNAGSRVWVFAQTDRIHRETYLDDLCEMNESSFQKGAVLQWTSVFPGMDDKSSNGHHDRLWLCNVDENKVTYF